MRPVRVPTGTWLGGVLLGVNVVDKELLHLLAASAHGKLGVLLKTLLAKGVAEGVATWRRQLAGLLR